MTERESEIIGLLHKEVKPALGCTEPIAVALAAAKAAELLHTTTMAAKGSGHSNAEGGNAAVRTFSRLGREAQGGQGSFDSVRKRTRRILWAALAVAASLTVFIFLNRRPSTETHDWFANVGNDQLEICQTYYEKAGELYEIILAQNPDGSMDESVGSIADGGVPLVDQLPDDMDPDARATILKEYYGELLNGLERMKNIK